MNSWEQFKQLNKEFDKLKIKENIDFDKFYLYSIIAHSTQIEGSTLTDIEIEHLFERGVTAEHKPISDHKMNEDLKKAYEEAIRLAKEKQDITPEFLKKLSAIVMKQTGDKHKSMLGEWDESKGDFRLHGVTAGVRGRSYVNFQKVPDLIENMCIKINERNKKINQIEDIYNLSFDAHFNFVTIHPFGDGNGRMARLLMNYIQFYHNVFPTRMYKEDKSKYIDMLEKSREEEKLEPIRDFLLSQHNKTLAEEIKNFKEKSSDFNLTFS